MRTILLAMLLIFGAHAATAQNAAIQATNAARAAQGKAPLKADKTLMRVAQAQAAHIARKGALTHHGPRGRKPLARTRGAGLRACWASENLAMGPWDDRQVAQAWLSSPAHRRNALNARATRVGAAKVGNAWVMVFAQPC